MLYYTKCKEFLHSCSTAALIICSQTSTKRFVWANITAKIEQLKRCFRAERKTHVKATEIINYSWILLEHNTKAMRKAFRFNPRLCLRQTWSIFSQFREGFWLGMVNKWMFLQKVAFWHIFLILKIILFWTSQVHSLFSSNVLCTQTLLCFLEKCIQTTIKQLTIYYVLLHNKNTDQ